MSNVSLVEGNNRYQNVLDSLKHLKKEIDQKIDNKKNIIIKVDLTSTEKSYLSTNVETIKAVLDFLKKYKEKKIQIIGIPAVGMVEDAFNNFNYYDLEKKYPNLRLCIVKKDNSYEIDIFSRDLGIQKAKIPNEIKESDFIISIAGLKTDDSVVLAMGIKNIAGLLLDRPLCHNGYKSINLSLVKILETIKPDLSIIDAMIGVEGDAPFFGDLIDMNIALTGTDFISVDTVGSILSGTNPNNIGYIQYGSDNNLGEKDILKINILGNTKLEKVKKSFRMHSKYEEQIKWE